ncbi:MAG: squalene/phytoene synthase family protein [Rhodobacteraceae bacterium]|nr:squalene/phytoene synthase family protein [Paracoccaceae bacterium]
MTLDACAALVERGDPDRWRAVLAAPREARPKLIPIYAFNLEVARAPWLTQEPLIAEMRLQWWADVLEEIIDARPVRRHEVATPLSEVLDPASAKILTKTVEARRRDVHRDAFQSADDVKQYLRDSGGALAVGAARALGADDSTDVAVSTVASVGALTRLLVATPELERRGWRLWRSVPDDALRALVVSTRADLRRARTALTARARPAVLADWRADALLGLAASREDLGRASGLEISPFYDRFLLLKSGLTGRV